MFRTADGSQIRHVHLCVLPRPETSQNCQDRFRCRIQYSLDTPHERSKHRKKLQRIGYRLWALEGGEQAESLFNIAGELPGQPILLIVGNEVSGVDPGNS